MPEDQRYQLADMPIGTPRRVLVEGKAICLARVDDTTIYAVDDTCSHEDASLSEGEILGREIECPLHLSQFDLETGEVKAPPAWAPISTYPVRIADGMIVVDVA